MNNVNELPFSGKQPEDIGLSVIKEDQPYSVCLFVHHSSGLVKLFTAYKAAHTKDYLTGQVASTVYALSRGGTRYSIL